MITFSKQENGVLFTFENSDKYLYGDGTILVPFNSLAVIQDESDMITLRKSASWDIFLSGRFDTDFGYASKEEAVNALKEILYDEAGISEEEVQQMIDAATSGIPSSQVIEQLRTDVNAVSGEVASKADESSLTAVNDALTAHTANTNIHVTSTDKSNWDAKQDALTAGANITISGNVISAEAGNNIIELTQAEYDALTEKDPDALYIITDAQEINMNDYATKTDLAAKADASALTAVSGDVTSLSDDIDALQGDVTALSGEVQTKLETSDFNAYSAATDARIAEDEEVTAAALNDLAETVSGKQDTLISGENIKTINNISILGAGNITVSGGGGGDYQYYSEDTTNESATIEVGEQSLTVDGNGVYVNNSPVVTAEELDDNYYTQQTIDEKEEVIASALTELNEAIGDPYQKVSGLTIDADNEGDVPFIRIEKELGDGNRDYTYINDAEIDSVFENNSDGSIYGSSLGQGSIDIYATDYPDDNVTSERSLEITTDGFRQTTYENYDDGENGYTRYSSENEFNYSNGLTLSQQLYDPENDETTTSSLNIINNGEGETYIELTDVDENSVKIETTGITINGDAVATESYVDAATSGKADTSAVTAVSDALTAHTANTNVHVTSAEKTVWNEKQNSLYIYTENNDLGTAELHSNDSSLIFDAGGVSITANTIMGLNTFNVTSTGITINGDAVATEPYVDAALSGKVDTSAITTAITSGSTDSEIPTAKATYDAIQSGGGGVTVDSTWVANSTNPVQSKMLSGVISNTFNLANETNYVKLTRYPILVGATTMYSVGKINGESIIKKGNDNTVKSFNLVETSAITSAMTSSSTDAQVPSAKAVYDQLGGLKFVKLTQAEYDALVTKDSSTLYIISD